MERFIFIVAIILLLSYYFKNSDDYDSLIQVRKVFKFTFPILFFLIVFALFPSLLNNGLKSGISFLSLLMLSSPVIIIFYNIFMWRWGINNYYDESHIENMDYFTLYLRSFQDDGRSIRSSKHIIECFYKLFCPFAVGKPYEILPPKIGAPRIYLSDNWKENVLLMMDKAQIILLRISDTENFIWEYEQVIENHYLGKTVFWIKDSNSLKSFINNLQPFHTEIWHNLALYAVDNECLVYLQDNKWKIYNKDSYRSFLNNYMSYRSDMIEENKHYLYDSGHVLKHFFSFHYDVNLMKGVPKWDWISFAFPELFFLLHRIEKIISLLILCFFDIQFVVSIFDVYNNSSISAIGLFVFMLIVRFFIMYLMGRNSRSVVWLSEKWESVEYYNKIYAENNKKVILVALLMFLGVLAISIF